MHINSDVWLIKPQAGLSTPLVFKHMDYNELSKEDPRKLLENFHKKVSFAANIMIAFCKGVVLLQHLLT
jgi:hypothetical protein